MDDAWSTYALHRVRTAPRMVMLLCVPCTTGASCLWLCPTRQLPGIGGYKARFSEPSHLLLLICDLWWCGRMRAPSNRLWGYTGRGLKHWHSVALVSCCAGRPLRLPRALFLHLFLFFFLAAYLVCCWAGLCPLLCGASLHLFRPFVGDVAGWFSMPTSCRPQMTWISRLPFV